MNDIDLATVLYRQLPEVYRSRDNPKRAADGSVTRPGDLARLLSSYGDLQTALHRTLLQRYYDIFPEAEGVDANGVPRGCQAWVLPYLAQLLDVVPLSPLESGQRAEVGQAVAWRQRKGTPEVTERIAEAVAGLEMELQEGWQIVATTARPGFALLPAASFAEADPVFDGMVTANTPGLGNVRSLHPGLPNGTLDLRRASRALRSAPTDPTAHTTNFNGTPVVWRQRARHGTPCFPDSYQDISARTADLRTPDWRRGHVHPRRVLLHAAPFAGYFDASQETIAWATVSAAILAGTPLPAGSPLALETGGGGAVTVRAEPAMRVKLTGNVNLNVDRPWRFENIWFDDELKLSAGALALAGCAVRNFNCVVNAPGSVLLSAQSCLFDNLLAAQGKVELEFCTVLHRLVARALNASDCILMQMPQLHLPTTDTDVPVDGCIRFSRLPERPGTPWESEGADSNLRVVLPNCSFDAPVFVQQAFGEPGNGVLHPATPGSIRYGAEDGGEMGAYHALRYTLREQAVLDKLADFLPIGIEPVLIPDSTLLCAPPDVQS